MFRFITIRTARKKKKKKRNIQNSSIIPNSEAALLHIQEVLN
jgi:hypothetical protein